jgi:hypothetical protein
MLHVRLWILGAFLLSGTATAPAQSSGIPRYEVYEAALTSSKSYSNPFTGVSATATFTAPSGRKLTAQAFHDGGSTWRFRVAPDEVGAWTWSTSCSDTSNAGLHGKTGSFTCTSSSNKGFVRPDASRKYWFSYADGSPFFGMGDTCYGMVSGISNAQRTSYLNARSGQKFNFVRFFASGYPFKTHGSLAAADVWPWGGSASSPDYDRLNPQFFRRLETILGELKSRGMHAEVEVFAYYALPFTNPSTWTAARQNLWGKYVVSRLAAYPTVFLWTVTNEYETYPDGKYRYDSPSDDTWARSMGALFHANDPHRHPTTVHNFTFESNGGIGGRFGAGSDLDVLSQQKWGNSTWNGQYLDGDAAGVEQAIWTDRTYNKPVINTENGYEWLSGYPNDFNKQVTGTDKCRKAAWRVFAAGGSAYAAGFAGTWHGRDAVWENNGIAAPFQVADNGLAGQLGHYLAFIQKTDFRAMAPAQSLVNSPNLCLASAGKEYVVYAPSGGTVTLNLSSATGSFAAEWLNPRTGAIQGQTTVSGGASRSFTAPDPKDWVLRVKASSGGSPGLPDVIVTSLSYANGTFTCTVKNQGTAATPSGASLGVGYSVDGTWRTYGTNPGPLAAGASITIGTNGAAYVIPNGTHTITAWVDDVNRFAESNENNNQLSQSVTIGSTPPPPTSLRARWTLDETSGTTAADSSGNGAHGTLINGPVWSAGRVGGALSFDGLDDRVQVADRASLDLTSQGTISAWIHPLSLPDGYATVVEKFAGGSQGAGFQLLLGASNTAGLWLMSGGTSSKIESDANLFALNAWTHIAATWNGSTVQFYKNGAAFGAGRLQPRSAGANTLPLVMGLDTGYTGRLRGLLDDVQLHDRALAAAEVQALASGATVTSEPEPAPEPDAVGTEPAPLGNCGATGAETFLVLGAAFSWVHFRRRRT